VDIFSLLPVTLLL